MTATLPPGSDVGPGPDEDDPPVVDDAPDGGGEDRHLARRVVIWILAGLLVFALLVVFLLPQAAGQRQQHLRDEYREAASDVPFGDAALLLQIPVLGLDQVVVKGATPDLLRGGPGWRAGSAPPGQGNTVIVGRSTLWSYPFGQIEDLQGGNSIFLRTRDDRVYRYKVTKVSTVDGDETEVMRAGGSTRLTLITSAGGPLDSRRVVVQAAAAGAQPPVPEDQEVDVSNTSDVGSFDERPLGDVLLLLGGIGVLVIGIVSVRELRRRYGSLAVFVVAVPPLALGVVLILFHLDALLPITY
jgi:LPXTG-site transpeptidase (sortase) family protein